MASVNGGIFIAEVTHVVEARDGRRLALHALPVRLEQTLHVVLDGRLQQLDGKDIRISRHSHAACSHDQLLVFPALARVFGGAMFFRLMRRGSLVR